VDEEGCGYCWGEAEGCWTGTADGPTAIACTGVRAWQWQVLPSGRVAHADVSHEEWHAAGQHAAELQKEDDVEEMDATEAISAATTTTDGDGEAVTMTTTDQVAEAEVDRTTTDGYEEPLHWAATTTAGPPTPPPAAGSATTGPPLPAPPTPPPTRAHIVFRLSTSEEEEEAAAAAADAEEEEEEDDDVSGTEEEQVRTEEVAMTATTTTPLPASTVPPRPPCLHGMTEDECAFRVEAWEKEYGTTAPPATRHTIHFAAEPTPEPPPTTPAPPTPPSPAPTQAIATTTTATTTTTTTTTTATEETTATTTAGATATTTMSTSTSLHPLATPSPTHSTTARPATPPPTTLPLSDDPFHIRLARNDTNLRAWMSFNVTTLVDRAKASVFRGGIGDGARTPDQVAEVLEEIAQELRSARWAMRGAFADAIASARASSLAHALHMPPSLREDERRVGACARTVSTTMNRLVEANKVVAASRRDLDPAHTPRLLGYVPPRKGTTANVAGAWVGGGWRLASNGQPLRLEGRDVLSCGGGRWIMFVGDSNMRALYDDTVSVVRNALAGRPATEGWTHTAIAERTGAWGDRDALIGRRKGGEADPIAFRADDEEALYLSFRFVGSVGAPVGSPDEQKWRAILDHPRNLYTFSDNLSTSWDFDNPRTLGAVDSSPFARTRRPHDVFFSAGMWDLVLGTRPTDVAAGGAAAVGAFARAFSGVRAHGSSHLTFITPSRTAEDRLDPVRADALANHRLLHQLYAVWRPALAKLPNVTVIDSWTFFPPYVVERPVLLGNTSGSGPPAGAAQSLRSGAFLNAMLVDLADLKEHDGYHDAPLLRSVVGGALFKQVCRRRKVAQ
jgi:hypothetical protein